jgi:subtilisin family serine protease
MPLRLRTALLLLAVSVGIVACGSDAGPAAPPADLLVTGGNNQIGGAGLPLPLPLAVKVVDKSGAKVAGVAVTFAVTAGGGSLSTVSTVSDRQGQASSSWTLGVATGTLQTVTATAAGLPGTVRTFQATVVAGPPAEITPLGGSGQTAEVGTTLPQAISFELHDAFGNLAANQVVTWVPVGGGSVPAASVVTDGVGQVSTVWTLGYFVGPAAQALELHAGGLVGIVYAGATLTGGTLSTGSGDNQLGLAAQALAAPVGAVVRTAGGQPVGGVTLDWAVTAGGGSVAPATSTTDASGQAATAWTLGPAGAQSLTASNASLTPTSVSLTATAVVPPPSTITGSITLVNAAAPALRNGLRSGSSRAAEPAGHLSVSRGRRSAVPGELLVTFRPAAIQAPGLRAMSQLATAQAVAQTMMARLATHLVPGKVEGRGVSPVIHTARILVADAARVDSVAQALRQDPAVAAVIPNGLVYRHSAAQPAGTLPNDPNYPNQSWHYSMVGLPRAWSITTGSAGVIVAVLDDGVIFNHPALGAPGATYLTGGGNLRNDGYDFASSFAVALCTGGTIDNADDGNGYDPDPTIPDSRDASSPSCLGGHEQFGGHGLHTTGTVGAKGNDGQSVTGVNWTASIRPVRVLGIESGSDFDVAQGILYAGGLPASDGGTGVVTPPAQPARIISMSLGGGCPTGADPMHDAIQAVTDAGRPNGGVLVVVSAGNESGTVAPCPAAYPEVLAVGAVGPDGTRASYSNFGPWVGIAAPGGETNAPDATYWVYSSMCDFTTTPCTPVSARLPGTSMAAPHVAGVAALLLAQDPALTPAQLRARLTTWVTPIDPAQQLGPGIVNARNALTQSAAPTRQLYARAYNAATGQLVATVPATGGQYTIGGLADGSYFVFAGEDESGDGQIGLPDRRFGALGSTAAPTPVSVSSSAGALASFSIGLPGESEPNEAVGNSSRLVIGGTMRGTLSTTDVDLYRVDLPAGSYTFETAGWGGGFCSFALDVNTTLTLLNGSNAQVAQSVDIDPAVNNYCSRISATLAAGTYYVRVTPGDLFGTGTHSGRYQVQARSGP